ncbi:enoyl-CoA delta isomerase 3, peroxisomal [Nomia melanderi]|uniref:enoyl-CoA delta isomerase 3, peroxisomal n=1 Tax=Nomia melanderi TaxID=2448451 RepID=UPI0013041A85|nr:enoyl-CoA delta isomerase 3, peroxisomal [Nomia melanderi]
MTSKGSTDILHSVENGILKIVLNRPHKKNSINVSMYKTLSQLLHGSIQDNDIHTVVLTGSKNFFSSGNDFLSFIRDKEGNSMDMESALPIYKKYVEDLITYPKLLIAIVNGPAIGIAVTTLPLFDMVYASDKAYFYTPFTKLGIVAEGCSTYTFPKILKHSKAGDMLYLGYKMNAFEAKEYGLVSHVYKHEHLNDVWTYLKKISALSIESIFAIKRLVKKWDEKVLLEVHEEETNELIKRIQSPEFMQRLMETMLHKSKI